MEIVSWDGQATMVIAKEDSLIDKLRQKNYINIIKNNNGIKIKENEK